MFSIRVSLLLVVVAGLAVYAYRDWFASVCGMILLMAFVEHPDFPKTMFGIDGLNPWNLLLANNLIAWAISRRRERLVWDMPKYINVILLLCLAIVLIGFYRAVIDRSYVETLTLIGAIKEQLVNTIKWVIPGLLLFDGCRTRRRLVMATLCILGVYSLLAVQVVRWMPPSSAMSAESLSRRSLTILLHEIGYHRVNISMMFSGASWAVLATLPLVRRSRYKALIICLFLFITYAQALTGGRMGYVTWAAVGFLLCLIRWRRYLLLTPLVPIVIALVLPGTAERMFEGFQEQTVAGDTDTDEKAVTAGRIVVWPYVIDKIIEAPITGYGRLAMVRTGLTNYLFAQESEGMSHPHNAYLECLLDNGLVGFLVIMSFYTVVVVQATRLFLDSGRPWYTVVGGITLALVLALLCASMGSQTFYPREGAVAMWAAIGLMLRLAVERQNTRLKGAYSSARGPKCRPAVRTLGGVV